ncbi:MAG: hypothetical protein EBR07_03005, partial [Planctomycetes bacterium]|nr:hypothetical protein [Planctomycetota bacterium]
NTDGVIFALAGSAGAPFSGGSSNGILSSSAISTAGENGSTGAVKSSILDSNVSNLDAGDLVRFAIVIENIGTSYRGAFNGTENWLCGWTAASQYGYTTSNCGVACPADLNGDHNVGGSDLGALLGNFGGSGSGDINNDGVVNGSDLGLLLGAWGACQ